MTEYRFGAIVRSKVAESSRRASKSRDQLVAGDASIKDVAVDVFWAAVAAVE